MNSSWLSLVPVCDGYAFNAAMICDDCAAKTIEHLESKGVEDTGDSNDFPQGPYRDQETDTPEHCDNGPDCINAIRIPGGKKIGCPISCVLTEHGVETTKRSIAEHVLFGSPHQKAMGRLWWHLFHAAMDNTPILLINRASSPLPPPVKNALSSLTSKTVVLLREMYTDLDNVYGGAISHGEDGRSLILWRLTISDTGKLSTPNEPIAHFQLPHSELQERPFDDIITEAISDGAFEGV